MRIGIDARMYSSNFTGIGRYVYELTKNLFFLDMKNEYVIFFNEPEYSKFDAKRYRGKVKKVLVNCPHYSLKEQIKFLHILNKEKLDLMHFTHFNAPLLYLKPKIVTIHDLTLTFFPGKKMTSIFHRAAYHLILYFAVKKAKHIIAVSENTKNDLRRIYKLPDDKISVIYEGVNPNFKKITDKAFLDQIKTKYSLKKPFLLYTGVWRSHKNLKNLITAFSSLINTYELDIDLVITGKEDPFYPEVKDTVSKLNLTKNVKFTGLVPDSDLIALYNLAEIYVLPSLYEGFGLTILEAFICGTPLAASNTSCIPEICGTGNAMLFDPYNTDDMAYKINKLYTDKKLQKELIKGGFERAHEFSWVKMTACIMELYESFIPQNS